jgi:hypothetical protein
MSAPIALLNASAVRQSRILRGAFALLARRYWIPTSQEEPNEFKDPLFMDRVLFIDPTKSVRHNSAHVVPAL